mgnify:CR=1 FL=1
MQLSEITKEDRFRMIQIWSEGITGHEDNVEVDGCITLDELRKADKIMNIVFSNLTDIIADNEKQNKNKGSSI